MVKLKKKTTLQDPTFYATGNFIWDKKDNPAEKNKHNMNDHVYSTIPVFYPNHSHGNYVLQLTWS